MRVVTKALRDQFTFRVRRKIPVGDIEPVAHVNATIYATHHLNYIKGCYRLAKDAARCDYLRRRTRSYYINKYERILASRNV